MAKKANATCSVCGKKYYLCIACDRHKIDWKPWKVIVDNENCYNIYDIVSKYIANNITKEEAKELLTTVDLSGLNDFKDFMRSKIEEILELRDNKVEKKTIVEDIVSEEVIEDKVDTDNEAKVVEERSTKKNFKKKD